MTTHASRRAFLRQSLATVGGLGFTSAFGGLLPMPAQAQALAPAVFSKSFPDYKALVCVFLYGGNDSLNLVAPRSDAEYAVYLASRQNLAVAKDSLLAITPTTPQTGSFGLHPGLATLKPLFDAGRLALVANTGPLIQPTTKAQYQAKTVALPPQLFSHNDQQNQWQSLRGRTELRTGWAGRIADELQLEGRLSMNVSLAGSNVFQTGVRGLPYGMTSTGAQKYSNLANSGWSREVSRRNAFLKLLAGNGNNFEQAYADVQQRSFDLADAINGALGAAPVLNTVFPTGNRLADQLKLVARTLAIRSEFALPRQVFFVSLGGFDTHDDQLTRQPVLYAQVAEALSAFYQATVELGISSQVTSFTASDFGRTLTSNGDGTDHGWGSHQLVLGGAVKGGDIYGRMPDLALNGPDDAGSGRLIPTTSVEQYSATLARWFGLDDAELAKVMPNLVNFGQKDLGFLV